jgi:hypothetical protein
MLLSKGNRAEAISHFPRALETRPDHVYARDQLRKAQAARRQYTLHFGSGVIA